MQTFRKALDFTLSFEGGYVNDPDDRGGETNKGITKKTYDAYRASKNLPERSVRLITEEEVEDIYYRRYWFLAKCDTLTDERLAISHFDAAVNCGVSKANDFLLNSKNDWKTYNNLRVRFYYAIVARRPSQIKFLKGWLRRVKELNAFVSKIDVTKTIKIFYKQDEIGEGLLIENKAYVPIRKIAEKLEIKLDVDANEATLRKGIHMLESTLKIINNTGYVHARVFTELGFFVHYNQWERKLIIS